MSGWCRQSEAEINRFGFFGAFKAQISVFHFLAFCLCCYWIFILVNFTMRPEADIIHLCSWIAHHCHSVQSLVEDWLTWMVTKVCVSSKAARLARCLQPPAKMGRFCWTFHVWKPEGSEVGVVTSLIEASVLSVMSQRAVLLHCCISFHLDMMFDFRCIGESRYFLVYNSLMQRQVSKNQLHQCFSFPSLQNKCSTLSLDLLVKFKSFRALAACGGNKVLDIYEYFSRCASLESELKINSRLH